jgi:predicted amidohydrolase YtcJ
MRFLHNARIHTQNPKQPAATALAVHNGRIEAVGSDEDILALDTSRDQKQDMGGKVIWPGLTDAHLHMQYYSGFLQMIDCETGTKEECLRRVDARARSAPSGAWVLGHGWNQNEWQGGFGSAADLDAVSHGHPVFLTSKSLHSAWANSLALQKAGVGAATPNPQDGTIGRDASGQLTGILFESAAGLVEEILPEPSMEALADMLESAQAVLWKMGITGVHDFDRRACFQAMQYLDQSDRLRLRVVKSIPVELLPQAAALGLRTGFGSPFLRIGSVKLFADGALGPRTAAMLQPYEGESEYTGFPMLDAEQIVEFGQQAVQTGISMAIHAIGDRANHEVLNAYEQLRGYETEIGAPHLRHRIEHVQILHPDDAGRLASLNVIASMQPIHATSDMYIADKHWGRRSVGAYAWRTQLERGARLAFGSDAPVESPNPFWGLHAAVTRARHDGQPAAEGWYPEQRLSLQQALDGYTTGPAYAAGLEHHLGQLTPGFAADLIVLEDDPFALPPARLYQVAPVATMVAGEWVWQA